MFLSIPQKVYTHGWGDKCTDSKTVITTRFLIIHDPTKKPTTIAFDIMEGISSLIVGLDISKYSNAQNKDHEGIVTFTRPTEKA